MPYNPLEFTPIGITSSGDTGSVADDLAVNPGPNTWVYLYADTAHDDPTDRELGIWLVSLSGAGTVLVSDYPITPSEGRVPLLRPIIVLPGENLQFQASAMSTAARLTSRAVYIEVPQGQTVDHLF